MYKRGDLTVFDLHPFQNVLKMCNKALQAHVNTTITSANNIFLQWYFPYLSCKYPLQFRNCLVVVLIHIIFQITPEIKKNQRGEGCGTSGDRASHSVSHFLLLRSQRCPNLPTHNQVALSIEHEWLFVLILGMVQTLHASRPILYTSWNLMAFANNLQVRLCPRRYYSLSSHVRKDKNELYPKTTHHPGNLNFHQSCHRTTDT